MTDSKGRGRQRSTESEEAILKATLQLLKEKPLRDISVDEIARKAGVGKMTIYKWWPSKAYVALDAFLKKMNRVVMMPDTGDMEKDLAELLYSIMSFYISPTGRIFSQFLAESQSDPEFAELFRQRFLKPRRESAGKFLDRAMERGVIDHTLNREIVLDLIFGPMVFRLMAGHAPLNRTESDAMISTLLRGIRGNTATSKRASGDVPALSHV